MLMRLWEGELSKQVCILCVIWGEIYLLKNQHRSLVYDILQRNAIVFHDAFNDGLRVLGTIHEQYKSGWQCLSIKRIVWLFCRQVSVNLLFISFYQFPCLIPFCFLNNKNCWISIKGMGKTNYQTANQRLVLLCLFLEPHDSPPRGSRALATRLREKMLILARFRRMIRLDEFGQGKDSLLYEYRDLFINMDVRNNRSELAIANRHQERWNFTRWKIIVHGLWLDERCFFTSENLSFSVLIGWPERATPARRLV